jgi:hypothetical protein
MALGANVALEAYTRGQSAINAYRGKWTTIISAGGPAVQDNAAIVNPATQIVAATRHLALVWMGTIIELALGYDDELASITDPVVKLFGRRDSGDRWSLIRNLNGDLSATLATDASDVTDGTLKYTTPDPDVARFNIGTYGEVLVGVETALAGTGVVNNSIIQARVWS